MVVANSVEAGEEATLTGPHKLYELVGRLPQREFDCERDAMRCVVKEATKHEASLDCSAGEAWAKMCRRGWVGKRDGRVVIQADFGYLN
jgi:hypothetical protein